MRYFLIGFAIWFALAWLPQFAKSWWVEWKLKRASKRATEDNEWMYK